MGPEDDEAVRKPKCTHGLCKGIIVEIVVDSFRCLAIKVGRAGQKRVFEHMRTAKAQIIGHNLHEMSNPVF